LLAVAVMVDAAAIIVFAVTTPLASTPTVPGLDVDHVNAVATTVPAKFLATAVSCAVWPLAVNWYPRTPRMDVISTTAGLGSLGSGPTGSTSPPQAATHGITAAVVKHREK